MKLPSDTFRLNAKFAKSVWGKLSQTAVLHLKKLTAEEGLVVASGDLQLLQGRWYVTHTGLLRLAQRKRCLGIETILVERVSDPDSDRWVFKATVYKSSSSRGFVGYGDANPSNVSSTMHGAELRIAETRAVNRALRKAYGIGIWFDGSRLHRRRRWNISEEFYLYCPADDLYTTDETEF